MWSRSFATLGRQHASLERVGLRTQTAGQILQIGGIELQSRRESTQVEAHSNMFNGRVSKIDSHTMEMLQQIANQTSWLEEIGSKSRCLVAKAEAHVKSLGAWVEPAAEGTAGDTPDEESLHGSERG